jgi:hypothetical protein
LLSEPGCVVSMHCDGIIARKSKQATAICKLGH